MDGVVPLPFEMAETGALRVEWSDTPEAYLLRGVLRWSDEVLLLQFEVRSDGADFHEEGAPVESIWLGAHDGVEIGRSRHVPLFLALERDFGVIARPGVVPGVLLVRRGMP
ncbi:hypothetical protein [Gaopeijia maritima]|uniref:hypothetical protein n=1 Tax=Gaopeijia maritima TaxID=3119007 RepID=UPI00386CFB46